LATQYYETLEVYNTTGEHVDTIYLRDTSRWDATKYAEGIYYIVATEGNKKATQKIIVKKK
jgi:hypothetical protein